jgi:hypothetical protein
VPAPAVYRFICPDGRSYVGPRRDIRKRHAYGVSNHNQRLADALDQYPSDAWAYEVLQVLPPGCSDEVRYSAEQRHIDRLRSWHPDHGFNCDPADYSVGGPAREFYQQQKSALLVRIRKEQKEHRYAWDEAATRPRTEPPR